VQGGGYQPRRGDRLARSVFRRYAPRRLKTGEAIMAAGDVKVLKLQGYKFHVVEKADGSYFFQDMRVNLTDASGNNLGTQADPLYVIPMPGSLVALEVLVEDLTTTKFLEDGVNGEGGGAVEPADFPDEPSTFVVENIGPDTVSYRLAGSVVDPAEFCHKLFPGEWKEFDTDPQNFIAIGTAASRLAATVFGA
jgi:hypothetical protein